MLDVVPAPGDKRDAIDALFDDQPPTLTAARAAEILNIGSRELVKWLNEGTLPGYRLPGRWIVLTSELAAWLRERRNDY